MIVHDSPDDFPRCAMVSGCYISSIVYSQYWGGVQFQDFMVYIKGVMIDDRFATFEMFWATLFEVSNE